MSGGAADVMVPLLGLLEREVAGLHGPLSMTAIAGGRSNPTYLLEGVGQRYVLRSRPAGKTLPSAHCIDREVRVLRALEGTTVPVPQVLLYVEEERYLGAPFYLMSYVPGLVSENPALPDLPSTLRVTAYHRAIDALVALHAVPPAAKDLVGFAPPGDYNQRQLRRWTQQVALGGGATPTLSELGARLADVLPHQQSTTIVHGDYRFGNLIVAPATGQVNAIVDWELSTLGDPFADLAYFLIAYDVSPTGKVLPGLSGMDLGGQALPGASELVQRYCRNAGRALPDDWPAYRAMALYRSAAIAHGVFCRRAGAGDRPQDEVAQLEALAEAGLRWLGSLSVSPGRSPR